MTHPRHLVLAVMIVAMVVAGQTQSDTAMNDLAKRYVKLVAQSHASTIPDTFRQAQPNLLPRVRERSYHSLTELYYQREALVDCNI